MSKSKHTTGPLTIRDNGLHENIAGAALDIMPPGFDPEQPKNKWPFPVATVSKHSPNYQANARLMAAARDLLAACKLALEACEKEFLYQTGQTARPQRNYPPRGSICKELADLVEPLRAAIEKAEGGDAAAGEGSK